MDFAAGELIGNILRFCVFRCVDFAAGELIGNILRFCVFRCVDFAVGELIGSSSCVPTLNCNPNYISNTSGMNHLKIIKMYLFSPQNVFL